MAFIHSKICSQNAIIAMLNVAIMKRFAKHKTLLMKLLLISGGVGVAVLAYRLQQSRPIEVAGISAGENEPSCRGQEDLDPYFVSCSSFLQ